MFEVFNEPQNDKTRSGWWQWKWGGKGPLGNLGNRAVGHQILVNAIRKMGAKNVLIVDGANYAQTLLGVPMLKDPLHRLAYGIHPFYYQLGRADWNRRFGNLGKRTRVIADEWNFKKRDCGTIKQRLAPALTSYLRSHHIGLFAHGFDIIGEAIANWRWQPTACGTPHRGSGLVVWKYLHTF
jgi:cellulase (glycosyl hydrolase family 5)